MVFRFLVASFLATSLLFAQPSGGAAGRVQALRAHKNFKDVPRLSELDMAAQRGLHQLRMLVNKENVHDLGMPAVEAAGTADLGSPLRDYLVRLDRLQTYQRGDDPNEMLTDTKVVKYPVVAGDNTACAVSLGLVKDEWKLLSIGDANRTALLKRAITESAQATGQVEDEYFVARIPALRMEFAGSRNEQGMLTLTPILDDETYGLRAGIPERAGKVLERLVPAAQAHDGLPR